MKPRTQREWAAQSQGAAAGTFTSGLSIMAIAMIMSLAHKDNVLVEITASVLTLTGFFRLAYILNKEKKGEQK